MLKGVHHIAYVVADLDKMVDMMERVFGMRPSRRETIEKSGQEVALYDMDGGATLEVIRPLHDNTDLGRVRTPARRRYPPYWIRGGRH